MIVENPTVFRAGLAAFTKKPFDKRYCEKGYTAAAKEAAKMHSPTKVIYAKRRRFECVAIFFC